MLRFQDHLLAEDRMEVAPDGSAIFYAENEWIWGAVAWEEGPTLRCTSSRIWSSRRAHVPVGMLLDEFLLRAALLEAKVAAPVFGWLRGNPGDRVVAEALGELTPVVDEHENR